MSTANSITIEAQDHASRDRQLEQATHLLSEQAKECGILITRHSFRRFTAALSPNVPYGLIHELDLL